MAAKKVSKWRMTRLYDDENTARWAASHCDGEVIEEESFVCPHCGKPWPMAAGVPLDERSYARWAAGEIGDYCCKYTEAVCEAAK